MDCLGQVVMLLAQASSGSSNELTTIIITVLTTLGAAGTVLVSAIKYLYGDVKKQMEETYNLLQENVTGLKAQCSTLQKRSDECEEHRDSLEVRVKELEHLKKGSA